MDRNERCAMILTPQTSFEGALKTKRSVPFHHIQLYIHVTTIEFRRIFFYFQITFLSRNQHHILVCWLKKSESILMALQISDLHFVWILF